MPHAWPLAPHGGGAAGSADDDEGPAPQPKSIAIRKRGCQEGGAADERAPRL